MEKHQLNQEGEDVYHAIGSKTESEILATFTPEQQKEILQKKQILSPLVYFVGKDFQIPIELNKPGDGWHWDFKNNIIRIDPKDLLEKPIEYLYFVISHEGGHRRISRTDFISLKEWSQPGFSFMMNAIEDPRMNNFLAENYPKIKEEMHFSYSLMQKLKAESVLKANAELGQNPRFMQAGFEYINQWFREVQGKDTELSADLPDDVKAVVKSTLEFARDSWWTYPSMEDADSGEILIKKYAKASYEINRDRVWPEFKKLIEEDIEDQKKQEALKDMQKGEGESENKNDGRNRGKIPDEFKEQLTPDEQKELEDALDKAIDDLKKERAEKLKSKDGDKKTDEESNDKAEQENPAKPIDMSNFSEGLKRKIKEYVDLLPDEKKKEIGEKAKATIKKFEKDLSDELQGKLSESPEKRSGKEVEIDSIKDTKEPTRRVERILPDKNDEMLKKMKEKIAHELNYDRNIYEKVRREVLPIIDRLESELREIFVDRKMSGWKGGFRIGKRIDIGKRIQEKAKSISPMESKAWQKREMPKEKDYAISLLVDLSSSMQGEKIIETFKAVVVLSEVLNRLSIKFEVLGFNDRGKPIYEYQTFGVQMSKQVREKIGTMISNVAGTTETGWAISHASKNLIKQKVDQKFLIVLTDGEPNSGEELVMSIENILKKTDIKLVGLGIGAGTAEVTSYFPNSIGDIKVEEMAEKLAGIIKAAIADFDTF